jgi:hypothetical protein
MINHASSRLHEQTKFTALRKHLDVCSLSKSHRSQMLSIALSSIGVELCKYFLPNPANPPPIIRQVLQSAKMQGFGLRDDLGTASGDVKCDKAQA